MSTFACIMQYALLYYGAGLSVVPRNNCCARNVICLDRFDAKSGCSNSSILYPCSYAAICLGRA
jgi:hypothetical protein